MADAPPNILLVFADQMRGMDTGYAGNPDVLTPHLDRLAAEGCRFERAFSNSPVCTPARGSLLTGLYPHRHLAILNDLPIRTDLPTLASLFRQRGYAAGYAGKWHLDGMPRNKFTPPGPRRCGFDDAWAVHNCSHDYIHGFCYQNESPERVPTGPYSPTFYTNEALRFMHDHRDTPFVLTVSWAPPHNPYGSAPQAFRRLYDPQSLTLRPNITEPASTIAQKEAPALRENLRGYYAHITALDHEFGRLMNGLEELGLDRNTIVVFTSDHGDMHLSHGYSRKQLFYEESISIPLIFRWKDHLPAGLEIGGLACLLDILPTLLDLCSAPNASPPLDGVSLAPMLRGETKAVRDEVLIFNLGALDEARAQGVPEWVGLRTEEWTYARQRNRTPICLYNNAEDPFQMNNRIPGNPRKIAEWDARLDAAVHRAGLPTQPWPEMLETLGLREAWNRRERMMHPQNPLLIPESGTPLETPGPKSC